MAIKKDQLELITLCLSGHRLQRLEEIFIDVLSGKTPATIKNDVVEMIKYEFGDGRLYDWVKPVLWKCNSWQKLDSKIRYIVNFGNYGREQTYLDTLYLAFSLIADQKIHSKKQKKRTNKELGEFTICPLCWRYVYKEDHKGTKLPHCVYHEPGNNSYQMHRHILRQLKKEESNINSLISQQLRSVRNILIPHPHNVFQYHLTNPAPDYCVKVDQNLADIWPFLPLTERFIKGNGGTPDCIRSVVSTLDPVDRTDPNDPLDFFSRPPKNIAAEERKKLHSIFIADPGCIKRMLCTAEVWLALLQERNSNWGGKRANSGGKRQGAGRKKKEF